MKVWELTNNMQKKSEQARVFPSRTRRQVNETSWRVINPFGLDAAGAEALELFEDARIDVLSPNRFVQFGMPTLIQPGRMQWHTLIYVPVRGRIEWLSAGGSWRVEPGQAVFVGAGQAHGARSLDEQIEVVSIHANIRLGAALPDQPIFNEMVQQIPSPDYWHRQLELLVSLREDKHFVPRQREILRQFLMDIALNGAKLGMHKRHIDPRVEQAVELIREHLASPTVLDEVARRVKLSASRLRTLFSRELGVSPKAYHRNVRLQEVVRLLGERRMSLKEIAARLGYTDTHHLGKDFKTAYGMSPNQFRETM